MDPKILAFHLPQYHTFKENDEWWGNGFTEWINVKKAKPLFEGHNQPRIPLNKYYYDLASYDTRKWQAEIAQKYGIYGFCYYHYWFNGKLLMERPLESFLQEKEISLPYCFCWANEPWTRAWDGKSKEVIMPQEYGGEKEWKEHIDYLLPFFKDERYIKVDGAPMFVIYRTNNIENCDDMISLWNAELVRAGFTGIHVVEERNNFQNEAVCEKSSAFLDFEPMHVWRWEKKNIAKIKDILVNHFLKCVLKRSYYVFDYDEYWKKIISRNTKVTSRKKHYLGGFVDWDNTSRRFVNGLVCTGVSPIKFEGYMRTLVKQARTTSCNFIFLNAWNEWAEGTYLEPDEKNGYAYLQAIQRVIREVNE